MTKDKIKSLLDFVPLIILKVYAIVLIWTVATTNIIFSYEHYIGLTLLVITAGLFIKRHKLGVLSLGLTLLLGLFKVLSYSAAMMFHSFGGSINGRSTPEIKIQAIFLLWLLIHFILSGRHYAGIATKKYWQDLFNKSIETTNA
ncbi:MAG: hypothetical protein ACOVP7_11865 [Lacibacter sp.]